LQSASTIPKIVLIPITGLPPSRTALLWRRDTSDPRIREFAGIAEEILDAAPRPAEPDLEILILRRQLRALRRKTGRPKFRARDRALLAAAGHALPRERWASFRKGGACACICR